MSFSVILVLALMSTQLIDSGNGQDSSKFTDLCEFDLVDELKAEGVDILQYLPEGCETMDPVLRQSMKDESVKFREFMDALGTKEQWDEQVKDDERVTLDLDYDLRERVYTSSSGNCSATTMTTQEYVDCRMEYRQNLTNAINEPE